MGAFGSFVERIKVLVLGKEKDFSDSKIFHTLLLGAFFAWIGLGSDGLSSSCYGPEEAFLALGGHTHLAVIIALATVLTIFVIGTSYSQIIELFPLGGGGYFVASRLLSPTLGMVSGCALLIDYVLTISISIAAGADAVFSFLPLYWQPFKLTFAAAGVLFLSTLNLRGVKESVLVLLPIFLIFVGTHVLGICYSFITHTMNITTVVRDTAYDFQSSYAQLGWFGMLALLIRAYSMGAGTYTGIEAVSNGIATLKEPRVKTAKRTMVYMMLSLAFIVIGIMFSYLFYRVEYQPGRTLNAVLFGSIFGSSGTGHTLLILTLLSEAAILFVAAQTGFLGGPRVIANMAQDRWFPTRFTMLSDRLVTQNGILLMGGAALAVLLLTGGSVRFLVVLYSINVFITFVLSQLGMVRHWWRVRKDDAGWLKKITVNGVGLVLTSIILGSIIVIKFDEGGWITLLITGALIALVVFIKRHYRRTSRILRRLDALVDAAEIEARPEGGAPPAVPFDPSSKTAVLLVNGYNGLGLHTMFSVFRLFKGTFKNFVVMEVGLVDAGAFTGAKEVDDLEGRVRRDVDRYVQYIRSQGFYAEGVTLMGVDVVDEVTQAVPRIMKKFPDSIFFGGQLVFPEGWMVTRWLHNYTVFAIQRKFYYLGIPVVLLPIRI